MIDINNLLPLATEFELGVYYLGKVPHLIELAKYDQVLGGIRWVITAIPDTGVALWFNNGEWQWDKDQRVFFDSKEEAIEAFNKVNLKAAPTLT